MGPYVVVIIYVLVNQTSKLSWGAIFVRIELLRFEATEPTFNHDVVCPAAPAVHTLTDIEVTKQILVIITGKLAALI